MSETAWQKFSKELNCWDKAGSPCRLWWRDDDLISVTPELVRMHAMADEFLLHVLIAVIPKQMSANIGSDTQSLYRFQWCQHGFAHHNHASPVELTSEFPASRHPEDVLSDLQRGRSRLLEQFGTRLLPVFVPPWNRFRDDMLRELSRLGYRWISGYGREARQRASLKMIDAHMDVVDWSSAPHFSARRTEHLLEQLVDILQERRKNPSQWNPIGILTHHRAMDENAWEFMRRLLELTHRIPCVEWISPSSMLDLDLTHR